MSKASKLRHGKNQAHDGCARRTHHVRIRRRQRGFGIVGRKNFGKTHLSATGAPHAAAAVSTIKHAHHAFDIDRPARTATHRAAGATRCWWRRPALGAVHEHRGRDHARNCSTRTCDLVLVEAQVGRIGSRSTDCSAVSSNDGSSRRGRLARVHRVLPLDDEAVLDFSGRAARRGWLQRADHDVGRRRLERPREARHGSTRPAARRRRARLRRRPPGRRRRARPRAARKPERCSSMSKIRGSGFSMPASRALRLASK